jgi:hypothetical protein
MHGVSPAELAKRLGVSYAAVTTAINKGRLRESVKRLANGRYQLDLNEALKEWVHNTDVVKAQNAYGGRASQKPAAFNETSDERSTKTSIPPFSESRAIKEAYHARLAKLDFEDRFKQLVSIDKVKIDAFQLARTVRDALLNIPERMSAELAAESDSHRVHQRLKAELIQALQELSDARH